MPIPFIHRKPAPEAIYQDVPLPLRKANPISIAVFQWVAPIMRVGASRPLQIDDLWSLTEDLQCQNVANTLEANFMNRMPPSRRINRYKPATGPLESPEKHDGSDSEQTSISGSEPTLSGGEKNLETTTSNPSRDIEKGFIQTSSVGDIEVGREEGAVMEIAGEVASALPRTGVEGDDLIIDETPKPLAVDSEVNEKTRIRPDSPKKESGKDTELDTENVKKYGKKKAEKIAAGKIVIEDGKEYDMNLVKALYETAKIEWWIAFIFGLCGAALQVTAPLVTRQILYQLEAAYAYHQAEVAGISLTDFPIPRSVGYGIGLAIALFVMEMSGSLFNYQSQQRGAVIGFKMRSSLIDLIARKSMRLSGKSRVEMTNGRLTTMVSADASFLDFVAPLTLSLFIQPVQIVVGIALLIYTLGYSALVGLLVLILAGPLQGFMFIQMITYRQAQMNIVDTRVRLLSEIINNIRAVKLYAYENFFGDKVSALRRQELSKLRRNGINRATMFATMSFIPVLAAVLTFITYGLSGHALNAASIFSGLQYFNVLKQPISFLPMCFTAVSDASVAVGRIGSMLQSEELKRELTIDPKAVNSVDVQGAFQFDSATPPDTAAGGKKGLGMRDRAGVKDAKKAAKLAKKQAAERKKKGLPPMVEKEVKKDVGVPFALRDIDLKIPRGSLVCIVGRVGTGKTALLSGMINEMRQIHGHVIFGGPVSYVPQHAWVQSGTIRENITFSSKPEDVDIDRVNEIIDACGLRPDIEMWGDGDLTKIGEKGITLSGGQRQRICLARAAYDRSEVVLLDDPLSAVDAHVGHHLLHNCILDGPLASRTRILVTHHLDVLPKADLVLVMDRDDNNEGHIIQMGTFAALREEQGVFRSLMEEFGSSSEPADTVEIEDKPEEKKQTGPKTATGGKLLLDEEREVGSVSWRVYFKYGEAMGSWAWVAMFSLLLVLAQAATVGNSLFLGFWSADSIPGFQQGQYIAVYACLGLGTAVFGWAAMYSMILAGLRASFSLFEGAWKGVMRSPIGWHDRTPTGRIISRLSKDIEMLDDRLAQVWNQLLSNALSVVGTFALVVYTFPYLGLMFIPLGILYYFSASYYRQTSREVKRLDSIARSFIYSSFGEQLAGLAVIRAFGQQDNFERRLQQTVNVECQAYIITITIQRWLGVRLDFLSYVLVMVISIFGSVFRNDISPSKLGVVLTYSLSAASVFSQLVQLFAQVEQEMNNVERVQYYNDLEREAAPILPGDSTSQWPTNGEVEFKNVELRYRKDLPLVLKGVNFKVNAGEKVGIIGRTGAGKSSIAQALFRTVEISGGQIEVDGKNLRDVGLDTLRNKLAIIPQDAFLFGGTVRDNIDPTSSRTDAELEQALNLIHDDSNVSSSLREKFKLDSPVLNEGGNFSAGERQLIALVRALAKGCKVLLLDEATSSVDPETDALIQRIIQTEFSDITLLSIAHRLQTVIYYDRILVMDAGQVAEFDTPLALFDNSDSIFRSLCDKKNLNRQDLLKIQADAAAHAKDRI